MVLQSELAAQRQDFGFAKEKSFQKKVKVEKQAYIAKMTSAEQTKEEKLENEQRLAEYKLTRRLSALEKKDAVKKSMMKSQRKLDSYRMQKIQAVTIHTMLPSLCVGLLSNRTVACQRTCTAEWMLVRATALQLCNPQWLQQHKQTFSISVQHGTLLQKDLAFQNNASTGFATPAFVTLLDTPQVLAAT